MSWNSETRNFKSELTSCIYLEDSSVEIQGLKIYGSPYQPPTTEGSQECLDKWNHIPSDTDILVTHGPPLGFGDKTNSGNRAGCVDLLHTVKQRVKPKYHIFGHIHVNVNASTCNRQYHPCNPAIVFDIDIPSDEL